jgi:phage terminase large subunit-like protein
MAHASPQALERLESLLEKIRALGVATERSRGIFYRGQTAFLHFHEFRDALVADLKQGGDFVRYPVDTAAQQKALLAAVRRASVAVVKGARYTRASKPTGKQHP